LAGFSVENTFFFETKGIHWCFFLKYLEKSLFYVELCPIIHSAAQFH